MSSGNFTFPSPIGGVPFESDYAPSVIFAILYALLVPAVLWRIISPRSRNFVLIGTITFAIERVVVFGLRSEEARVPWARTSNNLTIYMQTTLSIGYISIANDLLLLLRCLMTSATLSGASASKAKYAPISDPESHEFLNAPYAPGNVPAFAGATQSVIEERAKERAMYRHINSALQFFFWVPFVLGTVAGIIYIKAETSESQAQLEQQLRYATGATSFLMVTLIQGYCAYAAIAVRGIDRKATWLLFALATLLNIISVYRIIVMRLQTDSLLSMAPGSLNSPMSKTMFYILHIVPEWLTAAILLSVNVRERFETGLWGDQFQKQEKVLLQKAGPQSDRY